MKRNVSKIFKQDNSINVYQTINNPDIVYKEYLYVIDEVEDKEEMILARKKLQAMKRRNEWPEFLIRPVVVEKLNKSSFTAGFPFVEGINLQTYMKTKDIDIHTLAKLMQNFEKSIYKEKDFVFLDFANLGNIIILPSENNGNIDFKLIDPDDVQFDEYRSSAMAALISPLIDDGTMTRGFKKCIIDGDKYNKQLDIRSMYALLYYLINGEDYFLPTLFEREDLSEYEKTLKSFNVPENSSLYEKSMRIVDEKIENEAIGDSLYELIDKGYELETYGLDCYGYKHRLIKK